MKRSRKVPEIEFAMILNDQVVFRGRQDLVIGEVQRLLDYRPDLPVTIVKHDPDIKRGYDDTRLLGTPFERLPE